MDARLTAVVLAAGKGTRMRSETPKVLHDALGRTLLGWVLSALAPLGAARTVVVVGHGRGAVEEHIGLLREATWLGHTGDIDVAVQVAQNGSGDALEAALPALDGFAGDVIVVNGDGTLFRTETMRAVLEEHRSGGSAATLLAIAADQDIPYGRVFRSGDGRVERIVETGEATAEELRNRQMNAGVYCFDIDALREDAPKIGTANSKGERYITDLFAIARAAGRTTCVALAGGPDELLGVNTHSDLAITERILQRRVNRSLMDAGARIQLPNTVLIEPTVVVEPGATIEPGCVLRGTSHVRSGARICANCVVVDSDVGQGATVGPFAYLRPGTRLAPGSKVGTFVEVKNASIAEGAKVPHLSYIGDAEIGASANIGAGTITANYRPELGAGKQRTVVGAGARTGSDNVFVAPVTIGAGAFTAAGSIVTEDVPEGALAIARARQVNLPDYGARLADRHRQPAGDSSR